MENSYDGFILLSLCRMWELRDKTVQNSRRNKAPIKVVGFPKQSSSPQLGVLSNKKDNSSSPRHLVFTFCRVTGMSTASFRPVTACISVARFVSECVCTLGILHHFGMIKNPLQKKAAKMKAIWAKVVTASKASLHHKPCWHCATETCRLKHVDC